MLKLNVQSLDEVAEAYRDLYEPDDDTGFRLKVDGVEALRTSKRREKDLRLAVENHNRELTQRVRELEASGATIKVDGNLTPRERFLREGARRLASLEGEAHAMELTKINAEMDVLIATEIEEHTKPMREKIDAANRAIKRHTIERQARAILNDIAQHGRQDVLLPHVLKRLDAGENNGEWQVGVIDVDGKPMTISIDDLKDELRHTPAFAPLVRDPHRSEAAAHARKVALALGEPPPSMKTH